MSISQSRIKMSLNSRGIIDSNSVVFNFLFPSFFAAIFSAVMQGVSQTATGYTANTYNTTTNSTTNVTSTTFNTSSMSFANYIGAGRNEIAQGGFQLIGWVISIGFGILGGLIIGVIYRLLNDGFQEINAFFNDHILFDLPEVPKKKVNRTNQSDGKQ